MWMFTAACPSRCTYCDIESQRGKKTLTTEEVRRVAGEILAAGFSEVMFAGGEPLLSQDLPVALGVFRGKVPTAVFTGGLPGPVDRYVRVLRDGDVRRIVYSMDSGDPSRNDLLRVRNGVTQELLGIASAVRDELPKIDRSVNTVVTRFNVSFLPDVWERMGPYGLRSWSLTLAGDFFQGSPRHALLDVSMLESFYRETVPSLARRLARDQAELVVLPVPYPLLAAGIPPARWDALPLALSSALTTEFGLYSRGDYNHTFVRKCGCPLVGNDVVIGVGGEVHPCSQAPIIQPDYVIGNIKDHSLDEILDGELLRGFSAGVPHPPCSRCWAPSNVPREVLTRIVAKAEATAASTVIVYPTP